MAIAEKDLKHPTVVGPTTPIGIRVEIVPEDLPERMADGRFDFLTNSVSYAVYGITVDEVRQIAEGLQTNELERFIAMLHGELLPEKIIPAINDLPGTPGGLMLWTVCGCRIDVVPANCGSGIVFTDHNVSRGGHRRIIEGIVETIAGEKGLEIDASQPEALHSRAVTLGIAE